MRDPTAIDMTADPHTERLSGVTTHGGIRFDVPFMSEIAPNLWQGGCRNGLMLPNEVEHVVSLYPWESYKIGHEIQTCLQVRMLDSLDQATDHIDAIARWINECRKTGLVLVHCQAGLNRSSLVVAYALHIQGMPIADAIDLIRARRSSACLCNPAFEDWLRGLE